MDDNSEMFRNKMKASRDPMSHRLIEKRRRDRMNGCLADLSRLIPAAYAKKGRGRVEKTEIIELAIKHLKQLQATLNSRKSEHPKSLASKEHFYLGYQECVHETTCYLVENEGLMLDDPICVGLLNHLNRHGKNIAKKNNFDDGERHFHASNSDSCCNSLESDAENVPEYRHIQMRAIQYASSSVAGDTDTCADECSEPVQQKQKLVLNAQNVANMETFCWQGMELFESPSKSSLVETEAGDVGNIGGMSTCSRGSNRSDEVYKYKTDIKERFNADQKIKPEEDEDYVLAEVRTGSSTSSLQTVPNKRKHFEVKSAKKHVKLEISQDFSDEADQIIPIFALHPKHSYYVPMTLNSALIMPQLAAANQLPAALHHIEISVSFASANI